MLKAVPAVVLSLMLTGCGMRQSDDSSSVPAMPAQSAPVHDAVNVSAQASGGGNQFNPYLQKTLPNTRQISAQGRVMLTSMGASAQSIESEAAHRAHWREELYPVVYGDARAPHEILVLLDFAAPASANVWREVTQAAHSLPANLAKVVVFGSSTENYGTDLMGLGIWISYNRPGQAMDYYSYALDRWNAVKAAQRSAGQSKKFTNEYDATVSDTDFPIHYSYYSRLRPPVSAKQEVEVGRYCYDAGNVNMYQAVQISRYYGVGKLPAVIVDGKPLPSVSASAIVQAMQ